MSQLSLFRFLRLIFWFSRAKKISPTFHLLPFQGQTKSSGVALIVVVSLWLATVCNAPLWRALVELPEADRVSWGMAFAVVAMMASLHAVLLWLCQWRYVFKPVAVFLLCAAALGAYFMWTYRVIIDATMLVNVFQTDVREARDLWNWRLVLTVLVLGVLPAIWVWRRPLNYLPNSFLKRCLRNLAMAAAALAVFALVLWSVFQGFSTLMREHMGLRSMLNPLNTVYALLDLGVIQNLQPQRSFAPMGRDAQLPPLNVAHSATGDKPPLLMLVLGETARSANFSLNGYTRDTNPQLNALAQAAHAKPETLGYWQSFAQVRSCGTSTAESLPCMFSHLGRSAYSSRQHDYENLLDVAQHAGMAVLWVDNQSGCKGVCDRVNKASTVGQTHPQLCKGGECADEILLQGLSERMAAMPADQRQRGVLIVLHGMGSHGPAYYKRSPAAHKKFMPECRENVLSNCSTEQLRNAYDNSIVYLDHWLSLAHGWLQQHSQFATGLVYVSDHGESLGEGNLYLHGLPYALAPDVQKHVPLIQWLSPQLAKQSGVNAACVVKQKNAALSHDHLFHSVLGLLRVQTSVYRKDWDWQGACRP